jgi:hypothetical protein
MLHHNIRARGEYRKLTSQCGRDLSHETSEVRWAEDLNDEYFTTTEKQQEQSFPP